MIEKLPVKGKMHAKNEFLAPYDWKFLQSIFSFYCLFRKPLFIFLFNPGVVRQAR